MQLNQFQKAVLATYGNGDFAHLAETTFVSHAEFNQALAKCGDTLLTFIVKELSTTEGCEDLEEALDRMATARRDIVQVEQALEALLDTAPKP
jgi:hypothetical protein